MVNEVPQKVTDPEADLSNAQSMFKKLAPMCAIAKRVGGIPQLAPQAKQLDILNYELKETKLCINLAKKGQHKKRDSIVKRNLGETILEYDQLTNVVKDEKQQLKELDCLNQLASKSILELMKEIPTEADELAMIEDANNRLRRIENRLDLITKKFCISNCDNKQIREEIHRLLVERNDFNIQWKRVINKLMAGKMYLMDVLEIATMTFSDRDEWCRKVETLKTKGLYQLNKDIAEMQSYDGELNHLAKTEEYLRIKGSKRICEADEIQEIKRLDETAQCEQDIAKYDNLLEDVFDYTRSNNLQSIIRNFQRNEITNHNCFLLLCEVLQESTTLKRVNEEIRQRILDQRDMNEARVENQEKRIAILTKELEAQSAHTQRKLEENNAAEALFLKVLKSIDDIVKMVKCDTTPLLSLLGNHEEVNRFNVGKFLRILETETKSLIFVAYGAVKPPGPTPKGRKQVESQGPKLVKDPFVEPLKPNSIDMLVPYRPCAYCVQDYMMNLVFETPAEPATPEYIESILHLEDINTKFGIFTLTIPSKRHPYTKKN